MAITPVTPDKSASCTVIYYAQYLASSAEAPEAVVPNTYQRYIGGTTVNETITFLLDQARTIDYIGIAAHTFGTHDGGLGYTLRYSTNGGSTWTNIGTYTAPTSNVAIVETFTAIANVDAISIQFTATTAGLEIGYVQVGESITMQNPVYGGVNPFDLNAQDEYDDSISETGQFLGRTIKRAGFSTSLPWQHLSPTWIRSTFKPFMDHAKTLPFFVAWRPDLYADAVAFGYSERPLRPVNMGGGSGLMSVDLNMRVHSDL